MLSARVSRNARGHLSSVRVPALVRPTGASECSPVSFLRTGMNDENPTLIRSGLPERWKALLYVGSRELAGTRFAALRNRTAECKREIASGQDGRSANGLCNSRARCAAYSTSSGLSRKALEVRHSRRICWCSTAKKQKQDVQHERRNELGYSRSCSAVYIRCGSMPAQTLRQRLAVLLRAQCDGAVTLSCP